MGKRTFCQDPRCKHIKSYHLPQNKQIDKVRQGVTYGECQVDFCQCDKFQGESS